jgi:hypothetical protein
VREVDFSGINAKISTLEEEVAGLHDDISEIRDVIEKQSADSLSTQLDDLEQYGRRNSVRIYNLKCVTHDGVLPAVIELGKSIGVHIQQTDIVRCHMIGAPKEGKCQSIVKFVHYWKRFDLIHNRSKLKGHPNKTNIGEDLTRRKLSLVNRLRDLKFKGVINSVWTSDGRVLYKIRDDGDVKLLKSESDFKILLSV